MIPPFDHNNVLPPYIGNAKEACNNAGQPVLDRFADVIKTIAMPKCAEKEIDDMMLTRYEVFVEWINRLFVAVELET